jgi:hypothetical protein
MLFLRHGKVRAGAANRATGVRLKKLEPVSKGSLVPHQSPNGDRSSRKHEFQVNGVPDFNLEHQDRGNSRLADIYGMALQLT